MREKEKGERLDVLVDLVATSHSTFEQAGVIIEVKGCWNDELKNGLEDQLKSRYLADNPDRCGLYIVGWFMCSQWDDEDARKRKTPKLSVTDARTFFDEQAARVSAGGRNVKALVLNTALR